MRVILNGWFWGQTGTGSGQYLSHLLEHLTALAPDNDYVLALWQPSGALACEEARLPAGCQALLLTTPFDRVSENLSKVWFEQVAFARACRRAGANIAHVPYWGSPLFPTVPTVATIHDLFPLLMPAYRGGAAACLYTRLVAASARRAAGAITVSQASQQEIVTHLRLPATRVRVTPEAAPDDMQRAESAQVRMAVRKYGLPEKFLLYLGGFDARKDVAGLLAAFALLAPREPPELNLVIAGRLPDVDSSFTPDPRRIALQLGIAAQVQFPGWIDEADKAALYTAARVFVFPSRGEGFGLPVLEALACGTPVITTRTSSLPEVAGGAGILVSPGDTGELAEAMGMLWHDDRLWWKLHEEALARAALFSWRKTAQATLDAYTAALAQPP